MKNSTYFVLGQSLVTLCAILMACVAFCSFDTENQSFASFCAATLSGVVGLVFFYLDKRNKRASQSTF